MGKYLYNFGKVVSILAPLYFIGILVDLMNNWIQLLIIMSLISYYFFLYQVLDIKGKNEKLEYLNKMYLKQLEIYEDALTKGKSSGDKK